MASNYVEIKIKASDDAKPDLEALKFELDAISLGDLLAIQEQAEDVSAGKGARKLFAMFADCLESWNVTRRGVPVPPTLEGVLQQDAAFILAVVTAWQQGMAQAPPPLPGGSPSGGSSAAASIPGLAESSRSPQSF